MGQKSGRWIVGVASGLVLSAIIDWRFGMGVSLLVTYGVNFVLQQPDHHLRGRRQRKYVEVLKLAQKRISAEEESFLIGGVPLPAEAKNKGFFIVGEMQSGKSLSISLLMAQAFVPGSATRGVIFDPKNKAPEFLSALGIAREKVLIFNPFDQRCVGWDMQADIPENPQIGLMIIREMARLFVPERANEGDGAYFTTAARELMSGVMQSFYLSSLERKLENLRRQKQGLAALPPLHWTLFDVVLGLHNTEDLREILSRHEQTLETVSYLDKDEKKGDIMTTVVGFFKRFQELARIWKSRPLVSFKQWKEQGDGQIIIFGGDREAEEEINNLNRMMLHRLTQIVTTGDVRDAKETWFFLDEFAQLG